ncbi:tRNA (cytosine-5-)-methyltransferase [Actinomortierella wolfii]|nr:tRNA (cytosine-5-)-methyltransferase [Actinomortierella wolfii]
MSISRSRDRMVRLLHKRGYVFRECLVAPFHFGVPNDRLRYFLMARLRSSFPGASATPAKAPNENDTPKFTFDPDREPIYTSWPFPAFVEDPSLTIKPYAFEMPRIENFLDGKEHEEANKAFLLTKKLIVERPNFRFDVLKPSSTRSSCFTKAYGSHHVKNGGGLLQTENMEQDQYDFADAESIARLGLRFFSPTEVARLHAFPLEETKENDEQESGKNKKEEVTVEGTKTTVRRFTLHATRNGKYALKFPETMTAIQRFRLLGNSLNVWVVAELLRGVLFAEHEGMPTDQQSCITDMEVLPKPNTNNNNKQERSSLDSGSDDDEKDEREPKRRREG